MQFTKTIFALSALAGTVLAAPAPAPVAEPEPEPALAEFMAQLQERAANNNNNNNQNNNGVSLTFTGINGTNPVYTLTAPSHWQKIEPNNGAIVSKVTIQTQLSTCFFVGARGGFFIDASIREANTIAINPAQAITSVACASLAGSFGVFGHFPF